MIKIRYTRFNPLDLNAKCLLLRFMLGPAYIIDGLVWTLSATFLSSNLALECSRLLAKTRISRIAKYSRES